MSEVRVNKLSPRSGTTVTLGDSGDTITLPAGVTLANSGTITGFTSTGIDDNATSTAVTINSSQQVGIGITTPGYPLQINSSAQTTLLHLNSTAGADANITFANTGSTDTIAVGTNNNDLKLRTDDGNIIFAVSENTEKMRIDSSGNVGIGTSSPESIFHVLSGSMDMRLQRSTAVGNNSTHSSLNFKNADTIFGGITTLNKSGSTKSTGADGYEVRLANQGNGYTSFFNDGSEAMRIDSSGNVGIGTSSPSQKLEVNGTIKATAFEGITMKPFFKVYKSLNTNLSSGVATKVVHNGVVYDPDNVYDNAAGTFTVPSGEAGFYFFNVLTRLTGSSANTFESANTRIYVNSSAAEYRQKSYSTSGGNFNNDQVQLNTIIELAVGDTVEVYTTLSVSSGTPILVGSGAGTSGGSVTRFEAFKLIGL